VHAADPVEPIGFQIGPSAIAVLEVVEPAKRSPSREVTMLKRSTPGLTALFITVSTGNLRIGKCPRLSGSAFR
jgi:hypothetical protein